MKYLFDTDVIIDHLRGRKMLENSWLESSCGISVITYGELIYGVHKSNNPDKNLEKIKEMLSDLRIQVVDLNIEIVSYYGKLKAGLEAGGKKLDEFDLLIAATAIENKLTLITRNIAHFKRVPNLLLH